MHYTELPLDVFIHSALCYVSAVNAYCGSVRQCTFTDSELQALGTLVRPPVLLIGLPNLAQHS